MKTNNSSDVIVLGRLIPDSGKIHQNQEVYYCNGHMCTIKATHYKDPPKILITKGDGNKYGIIR